jgi:hypothetical protein
MNHSKSRQTAERRSLHAHFVRAAGVITSMLLMGVAVSHAAPAALAISDPALFNYQELPREGYVDFVITQNSPSFEFHSGPSRYQAFKLPTASDRYLIDVISFLDDPDTPERAHVFYPIVALLTEDFLVSRTTDFSALRVDLPVFEYTTQPAYRLTVGIDPIVSHEGYLVVFTANGLLEKSSMPEIEDPSKAADSLRDVLLGASAGGRLQIVTRPADEPTKTNTDPIR